MFILSLALWERILLSMFLPIVKLSQTTEGWSGFEDWQRDSNQFCFYFRLPLRQQTSRARDSSWTRGSQSVVPGPERSSLPRNSFSGPTLDLVNHKFSSQGPAIFCVLTSPPRDSDICQSLRSTTVELDQSEDIVSQCILYAFWS